MPRNYLQRIAESSTRTSGQLRAPAMAPPLMPDFAGFPSAVPQSSGEEIRVPVAHAAEPVTQRVDQSEPAPLPLTNAMAGKPATEQPAKTPRPKAEAQRPEVPKPRLAPLQRPSPQRTTARWPRLRPAPEPLLQRAPETGSSAQPALPPPSAVEQSVEAPPSPAPNPSAPRATELTPSPTLSGKQAPTKARVDSQPLQFDQAEVPPAEPPTARHPGIQPAPRGDAPAAISAPAPRRESHIRIGRIDVRLNNRPAVPAPARPAAAPPQGASNWLEARYLSRFALRP